ncbi:MAG: tRNA guanosine(34) transglycosylase Tgt [Candidatus Liberibacter asiaticus]|uniref:tRNA guanosine(34) transglycosylase Tgt n=1 Tax=Liberibacter asiaticus TaxID=34021 RepID=UPI00034CA7BD|nr:tRNA guanosine(34) transglycosylase Tgt [Candidatus Liberibacter asiaticus]BAP25936.1 queuine tRNA-ribosyltransferase [Candidatus Liberibacter asiaticus str. Ishi-1]KAE9510599.1 Queuine tRNA-ribosyltransferase [Candidatus Liberibacter asiaticus]KAE9511707.1 Queuine tRNA-ribosyltransferase [Candidatus Liberibacter asiaticus]KAE9512738.1 Queuine tRNA-ribosyltransferase [Candidatus Liberibacter asiaticus]KAE9513831.1 Queuine tRNA-ribosyltransferase [Candidatus Liberibacter asiaticus]
MLNVDKNFHFNLKAVSGSARLGEIITPRGVIKTPAFMPVGTAGTVKAMYFDQVRDLGADVILGNAYHLMLRPGAERIARLGGLHKFIRWFKPILTDSGGFQVMSLSKLCSIDEQGVRFRSHIDGSLYRVSPEESVHIQNLLGSDIQMQLDECLALPAEDKELKRAMELSLRWAERSLVAFGNQPGKALFGIVQGGDNINLRSFSAERLKELDLKGYAIGGLAVGEPQEVMLHILSNVLPILPVERPHYLMGVGTPDDILKSVSYGVDMFDCVMPTRAGRHGLAFTRFGKINLRNARHIDDMRPLDAESHCSALRDYSRAYLHHLLRVNESLAGMILSWANLAYYQDLMKEIRSAIAEDCFVDFAMQTQENWKKGDIPPIFT